VGGCCKLWDRPFILTIIYLLLDGEVGNGMLGRVMQRYMIDPKMVSPACLN
jgi:hypothetical protein